MHPTISRRLSRLAPVVIAGFAITAVPAAASQCAPDPADLGAMTGAAVRADTRCLLNEERATRSLRPLTYDRRLTATARRHSRGMVAQRYFAHDSLAGRRFSARIAATGWMDGRERWIVGENLAWGTGSRATPRATVRAWMDSPAHRDNILHGGYRVVGIGIERGTPSDGPGAGITYTTDFGS